MTDKNRQLLKSSLINSQLWELIKEFIQTESGKTALSLRIMDANDHCEVAYLQGKLDWLDWLLNMYLFNRKTNKPQEDKTNSSRFAYLYNIFKKS